MVDSLAGTQGTNVGILALQGEEGFNLRTYLALREIIIQPPHETTLTQEDHAKQT